MTVIVGLESGGRVIIGGDSAAVKNWDMSIRADEKVFSVGPFIMGFTTSFRMGQLLRYELEPTDQPADMDDDFEYMVRIFVKDVRKCLRDGGWLKKDDEREEGGTFLVGYRGRLYEIDNDFQVAKTIDGYTAVGSGDSIAKGAMFAAMCVIARHNDIPTRDIVEIALDAAARYSAAVCGPFTILSLP